MFHFLHGKVDRLSIQEPALPEPAVTTGEVLESPSWTSSYPTAVQGSSSSSESQAIPESEVVSVPAEPEDAPTAIQELQHESTVVEESTTQIVSSAEVRGKVVCVHCLMLIGWLLRGPP